MSHSVELSGEAVSSQNSLLFLKLDTGQAQFPFFPVAFLLGFYDSGFIAEGGGGTLLHRGLADFFHELWAEITGLLLSTQLPLGLLGP